MRPSFIARFYNIYTPMLGRWAITYNYELWIYDGKGNRVLSEESEDEDKEKLENEIVNPNSL